MQMKKFNLTTRLNIKLICIVSIFMLIITAYSQWISLQERKTEYAFQLETITAFLANEMPDSSFREIAKRRGAAEKSLDEQVMAVNREIQPILAKILIPSNVIKYGIYSEHHHRIVAIGPDFDSSLLATDIPGLSEGINERNTARLGQMDNSIVWYGAPILFHVRPISSNGQITGYAFACINLDMVKAELWRRTIKALLGCFIGLLIVIMLLQDTLIKLTKDLNLFAEAILTGRAKNFESKISELTPVLKYISEQTEQMARLDRLNIIGEMAASIGHEVRNPMTTVRGFLQYMGNKEVFKAYKEQLALMIKELDRANSIITEFLSLAKNKAMNFRDSDLNALISEVFPLIQADAHRYDCQIELNLEPVPVVRLDENCVRQLLLNMVRNGIEAMPQGGTIKISTVNYQSKVLLSIADQGVGIPFELLDKLGTPFFTTKENGVGLGLAICYRIVHRHGASIFVKSELGKGTSFTIAFNCNYISEEANGVDGA